MIKTIVVQHSDPVPLLYILCSLIGVELGQASALQNTTSLNSKTGSIPGGETKLYDF